MGKLIDVASALLCLIAGAYLLQYNSPGQSTWFQIIGHGMGIYFIGKSLYVARATYLAGEARDLLTKLVEFAVYDHDDVLDEEEDPGDTATVAAT
jgi:hypothetical protein